MIFNMNGTELPKHYKSLYRRIQICNASLCRQNIDISMDVSYIYIYRINVFPVVLIHINY